MKSYKDLIVWQKAIELVIEIYRLTANFPKSELYGLVTQMKRAVVSICSCIAEGFGRKSRKEKDQFYLIAFGSALELENQIIISKRLGFIDPKDSIRADKLLTEVLKMLNKLTSNSRTY